MTTQSLPTKKQSRQQWLEERRRGIGGSDAAAAVGLSPWKSQYELWQEKRSPVSDSDIPTEAMRWGTLLEPVIRQRYCEVTKKEVAIPTKILVHPQFDWCLASLDGVTDDDRIFEAKTSRIGDGWGEHGSDEIPEYYNLQVQHYMAVTGAKLADIAVLIGSSDFRVLTVEADAELQNLLLQREREFWGLVQSGTPPEPTTSDDIKRAFPISRGDYAEVDIEIADLWRELHHVRQIEDQASEERERLESALKKAIGDRDGARFDDQVLATWKSTKPTQKFDAAAFQEAHPDLYAEFSKEIPGYRRFLLKKPKAKKVGAKR